MDLPDVNVETARPPDVTYDPETFMDRLWGRSPGDRPDPRAEGNWRKAS